MTINPALVQFANIYDTLKNYETESATTSVPSQSYSAGQYRTFTNTIELDKTLASLEILSNFSTAAANYYVGSLVQVSIDANFLAQTRYYVAASTLNITCYVINNTGGVVSNTAFDLVTEVRRFLTPFS